MMLHLESAEKHNDKLEQSHCILGKESPHLYSEPYILTTAEKWEKQCISEQQN